MVNEDIVTALRNAIDHGDTLESAKQIMINSGYNPRDVEEASGFVGGGVIRTQQTQPHEQLIMPNQKPSKLKFWGKNKQPTQPTQPQQPPQAQRPPTQQLQIPLQTTSQQPQQPPQTQPPQLSQPFQNQLPQQQTRVPRTTQQYNQQTSQMISVSPQKDQSLQSQLKQIDIKKPSHKKEIILLIVLLVLVGLLITTIVLKDTILGLFSG